MSSSIEPELPEENFISEDELKGLLERWIAPQPPKSLDQRVANSYHRELGSADPAAISAPFPQSQHEVVKMKFCSTCQEEFADKFSFCPVDGTPLTVPVSESRPEVVEPVTSSQVFESSESSDAIPEVPEVVAAVTAAAVLAAAALYRIRALTRLRIRLSGLTDRGRQERLGLQTTRRP